MPKFCFTKVYKAPGYPVDPRRELQRSIVALEDMWSIVRIPLDRLEPPHWDYNLIGWDVAMPVLAIKIVNEGSHSW